MRLGSCRQEWCPPGYSPRRLLSIISVPASVPSPPGDVSRHMRSPRIFVECLRCSTPPFSARGTLPVPTAGSAPLRVLPCPPSLGSSSVPHASKACIILFCTHVVKFPRNGPVTWGPSISWPHHFQREASKDSMLVCIQQVGRGRAWRTKSGSYLGNWPGSRHSSGAHVPSWSMCRGTEVSKQTNGFSGQLASLQHRLVHSYDEAEKVLSNG